jgi:uncharacterized protein
MGLFEARSDAARKERSAAGDRPNERLNIAFGVERLAFVGLKAPILALVALAILVALAVAGVMRIHVDDSLSELFRSETPEFKAFEEETR